MLEIGKKYDVTLLEWGDSGPGPVHLYGRIAAEIDGTLVKFVSPQVKMHIAGADVAQPETHMIVNTASLYFVSAVPSK